MKLLSDISNLVDLFTAQIDFQSYNILTNIPENLTILLCLAQFEENIANTDDPNRKYKDIVEIGDYINFFYIQ